MPTFFLIFSLSSELMQSGPHIDVGAEWIGFRVCSQLTKHLYFMHVYSEFRME